MLSPEFCDLDVASPIIFPGYILHVMLKHLIVQIVVVIAQVSSIGTHDWHRVVHIPLSMLKDSSTSSTACPPTSHRRNRCSTWLLRKVISRRYNFPSNTPGAAKITRRYGEITTPGTFGNIYHFGITLSWDPSFPYNFPYVLPVPVSTWRVDNRFFLED